MLPSSENQFSLSASIATPDWRKMGKDKEKKPKAEKGEKKAKPFKVPKLHSPRKEKDQGDEAAVKIVSPRHPLPEGISLTILKEGDSHSFPHHNSTVSYAKPVT